MRGCEDQGVEGGNRARFDEKLTIERSRPFRIGDRIDDPRPDSIRPKLRDEIVNAAISEIGDVLFKGDAKDADGSLPDGNAASNEKVEALLSDERSEEHTSELQ